MATMDNSVLGMNSPHRQATGFGNYNTNEQEVRPRAKTTMTFHSGGSGG